jgi:hypothetical protein
MQQEQEESNPMLDWTNPELVKAFELAYYNGFGFQPGYNGVLYLGCLNPTQPIDTEENILKRINDYLGADETKRAVFITDYLSYEFLTTRFEYYNEIPHIIESFLQCGFTFVTHTCQGARFEQGDTFNQTTLELKMVESLRTHISILTSLQAFDGNVKNAVEFISRLNRLTPMLLLDNYITQDGKEFCKWLRSQVSHLVDDSIPTRMPRMDEIAKLYRVLWYSKFSHEVGEVEGLLPEGEEEEGLLPRGEEECCICMENNASTLVSPCNHVIVCDQCSRLLRDTNDARTCVKCRRPIEWVSYSDTNEMDILD